jgi:hexosaminidase
MDLQKASTIRPPKNNFLPMKKVLFLFLILLITKAYGQNNAVHLLPLPVELKTMSGNFTLTSGASIGYNKAEAAKVAEMLASKLNMATGFGFKAKQNKSASIQLNLLDTPSPKIGKEGYTLESGNKGVVISANQPAGLFYGIQTLLQLLPKEIESKTVVKANWLIPAVNITDYPRFAWRGLMLDVSRARRSSRREPAFWACCCSSGAQIYSWPGLWSWPAWRA